MEEFNNKEVGERQNYYCEPKSDFEAFSYNNYKEIKFDKYPTPPKTLNGLIVFISLLALVAFISVLTIFMAVFGDVEGDTDTLGSTNSTTTSQNASTSITTRHYDENRPELTLLGLPTTEAYTATEVAEKVAPSMVSLLVYQNGALTAMGSGVVMTEDGYIITCAHIVNKTVDSLYYRVRLHNNVEYDAQVIGYDDKTDIAVVKIDANGLKPAEFASSENLKSGQDILAIGSPGGLEFAGSITDGIISSPNRYITKGDVDNFKVIQHTAAINPGNSGGALVNMYGQVVGINSAKIMATGYEGMGFATSISYAKPVIDDIIQYGAVVRRGRIGIEYLQFDHLSEYANVVTENNLPAASVFILSIEKSSDLANYDVREGDFLIGVNGEELTSLDVIFDVVYSSLKGDSVTLRFFRPYTKQSFEVTCKLIGEN